MDKLLDTVQTAVTTAKEKVPFLDGDNEPESKTDTPKVVSRRYEWNPGTGRFHDKENSYRFVSRAVALGETAVGQVVAPPAPQSSNGGSDGGSAQKRQSLNGAAGAQNRYSMRTTPERLAAMEQARPEIEKEKAAMKQAEAEVEQAEIDRYQAWHEQHANGQSMDEAFDQAVKKKQFDTGMESIYGGSVRGRQAFELANQIRVARAELDPQLNKGEFDEDEYRNYLIEREGRVVDRENKLQDLLIKYRSDVSPKQQDFIIDFSGGAYNHILEKPDDKKPDDPDLEPKDTPEPSPPLGPKIEELWGGKGEKEILAKRIMEADPTFYTKYVAARDRFVADEANALGAGWIASFRSKLPGRFKKPNQQAPTDQEGFDTVYEAALTRALKEYGPLTPAEELEQRRILESDAAYRIAWDVSKTKLEAAKEQKSSLSRRTALLGGIAVAAAAGAITAIIERNREGGEHWQYYVGAGALGALAGMGAAKMYRPKEDDSTVESNAVAAREKVNSMYPSESTESLQGITAGIEGVKSVTKREKRKAGMRYLGAAAIGATAGAGGHYLFDTGWSLFSNLREAEISSPRPKDDSPIDPPVVAPTEAVDPPATVHDEVPRGRDNVAIEVPPEVTDNDSVPEKSVIAVVPYDIIVDYGGSFTGEFQQFVHETEGVVLSDWEAYGMYKDLIRQYEPGEIFAGVDFYRLPNGDWGLVDPGPAKITPVGQEAISDWLEDNRHGA